MKTVAGGSEKPWGAIDRCIFFKKDFQCVAGGSEVVHQQKPAESRGH